MRSKNKDGGSVADARRSFEIAVAAHRAGQMEPAERCYREVHHLLPNHPGALHGLGSICLHTHRFEDAAALLAQAAELAPRNGAIRSDLANAFLRLGRYEDAAVAFAAAIELRPADVDAFVGLGDALSVLGKVEAGRTAFERGLAIDPNRAAGHFGLGNIEMQVGKMTEARAAFERAIALAPARPRYHRALADTARFVEGDPRLVAMERIFKTAHTLADDQKVELHFALAKAYDDLGRLDEAFAHLAEANALQRRLVPYDEAEVGGFFRAVARAFSPALLEARSDTGDPSNLPVFIVGMPRSGSSLVEQMLASHTAVFGAGELLFMNDLTAAVPDYPASIAQVGRKALAKLGRQYVERLAALAPGAQRIIDKLPPNFRHLGLIHLVLPNAKIIHVRRDPMDTCFSCYSKLFLGGLNFTYDLGELGRYHKMYQALMAHWRAVLPARTLLDVQYETLVGDFEAQARRIVDFCGLPWDARCLDFSNTERPVRTLSQSQVRQPLFASSIGRWRRYEKHLAALKDALR